MESIKIYYKECAETDFERFEEEGGVIIDVRTQAEFLAGHVEGAINIPLEVLPKNFYRLPNRHQPIITCCSSGMKSASAKALLEALGYSRVCNGGSYKHLHDKIILYGASLL